MNIHEYNREQQIARATYAFKLEHADCKSDFKVFYKPMNNGPTLKWIKCNGCRWQAALEESQDPWGASF